MLRNILYLLTGLFLLQSCALNDPDVFAETENYPFRLVLDEEGSDLPDAEDYSAELAFADYLGDLPSSQIILTYELIGEGDFTNVSIDEIIYEYEDDDCVFIREVSFDATTITIPVDNDLGSVPEAIEIVFSFNLDGDEASDGGFTFELISIQSTADVLLNDVAVFEYEGLENDLAGEWIYEITTEEEFLAFQEAYGTVSADLAELSFEDITGEVVFSFEFEEMTIEVELVETEIVTECEDGETESEEENLVIEIEAEYDVEDGEGAFEGSYFTDEGEELDFIMEITYSLDTPEDLILTVEKVIDEDNYEDGEELFSGSLMFQLIKD
jgi:hypothetical protein